MTDQQTKNAYTTAATKCCAKIRTGGDGFRSFYAGCSRNAVNEEGGNFYCKQHTPSVRRAKEEANSAERQAKWVIERKKRQMEFAAPDLYEALKTWVESTAFDEQTGSMAPVYAAAKAAIAKAEGR